MEEPASTSSINSIFGDTKIEDVNLLTKYYNEWKGVDESKIASTHRVPLFYEKPPPDEDTDDGASGSLSNALQQKFREEVRSFFLQRKSRELLDNSELKEIWTLLETHHTPPDVADEKMINYRDFKIVASKVCAKARPFFTAITFAKLQQRDPFGRVPILTFFNYVMRKTWLRQSRIGLSLYDMSGQGYLTEKDLELYISELVPTLPELERLDPSLMNFYICTAVRRFMFFLDPKHVGRVRIVDILASGFLDDLLELRDGGLRKRNGKSTLDSGDDTATSATSTPRIGSTKDSFSSTGKNLEKNWFSAHNALRVYGQYLNLDTDRNGLLSKSELKQYGGGSLTTVFVERLFQECLTYDGEMDYKAYLDFVLAMENKKDPVALQYFVRVLDVRQRGYLDGFSVNYFFRAIQKLLQDQDQPMVFVEDIYDEIFDMIKPKDPAKITVQDLIDCGQGDTVVNVLIDLNGFWTYENREYLATEQNQQEDNQEAQC